MTQNTPRTLIFVKRLAPYYTVMKKSREIWKCDGLFREGWFTQFLVYAKTRRQAMIKVSGVYWEKEYE